MTDRELMQQAFDAMNDLEGYLPDIDKAMLALHKALAQGEQEPVCDKDPFYCWSIRCQVGKVCKHTAPPKREWVGLTLNDITGCMCDCADDDGTYKTSCFIDYAKAIEQKLKDLNT